MRIQEADLYLCCKISLRQSRCMPDLYKFRVRLLTFVAPFLLIHLIQSASAQSNPNLDNGLKAYGSYDVGSVDHVDLATGALSVNIPIASFPQRGNFPAYKIEVRYASKQFGINGHCLVPPDDGEPYCEPEWQTVEPFSASFGAALVFDDGQATSYPTTLQKGGSGNVYSYTAHTADGAAHPLFPSPFVSGAQVSGDGTGFSCQSGCNLNDESGTRVMYSRSGIWQSGSTPITEDPNGNEQTTEADSIGRALPGTSSSATDNTGCTGDFATTETNIQTIPGYNSSSQQIKLCYTQIYIKTAFNNSTYEDQYGNTSPWQSGATVREVGPYVTLVLQSVLIYDGNSWSTSPVWTFHYNNGASGTNTVNYGDLTGVTFPTGGSVQYSYATQSYCGSYPGFVNMSRFVIGRTENANDGSAPVVTTYSSGTVNDGVNDTVHIFSPLSGACQMYETEVQYYSGSGSSRTLLKTVQTDYTFSTDPYLDYYTDGRTRAIGVMPIRSTTTLPNGLVSKVEQDYQTATINALGTTYTLSTGNIVQKREYDWGSGSPNSLPLIRCTATTYESQQNSSYMSANLLDLPATVSVYSGACTSGTLMSQDTYAYDESSLAASGVTVQRDSGASTFTIRGNLTSHTRWVNTTASTITERNTYYDTGERYQHFDFNNNPSTTYFYDTAYAGAYLTKTQQPNTGSVTHTVSAQYDFNTGLVTSFTDQNNNLSHYSYDSLLRITGATFPDGGCSHLYYPSFISVQETICMNSGQSIQTTTNFDGFGRPVNTTQSEGGSSNIFTRIAYDAQGRKAQVWNPSRCDQRTATSCSGETTWGSTQFQYDGLGRQTLMIPADGTATSNNEATTYTGNTTTTTDEVGNQWSRTTDALGRLTQVLEPNGLVTAPSMETDYAYDTLNNLLSVSQWGGPSGSSGVRSRSFSYDSLSRLLTSSNPETGTICYGQMVNGTCVNGYDGNGNLRYKTDARGIVITYNYDALDRPLSRGYSDGTLSSCYSYDSATNGIGLLAVEWTQAATCPTDGSADYTDPQAISFLSTYDKMGRLAIESSLSPAVSSTIWADYDLAGHQTSLTYPDGRTMQNNFDAAGRLSSEIYASFGSNSVNVPYFTVATTNGYDPAGHLASAAIGNNVPFITSAYDTRERMSTLKYGPSTAPIWSKQYAWTTNSNLQLQSDLIAGVQRQFTYDTLNRLTSAQDISSSGGSTSGQTTDTSYQAQDNTLQNSQQFGALGWGASSGGMEANSAAAPDGSMTAGVFTANDSNAWVGDAVPDPALYSSAQMTASVWLKVPTGTLSTTIYLLDSTSSGSTAVSQTSVGLTTAWQQFTVSGTTQDGLTSLSLKIGGDGNVNSGQVIDVWGPEMEPLDTSSANTTNILQSPQQVVSPAWRLTYASVTATNVTAPDSSTTATAITAASGANDAYFVDNVADPATFNGAAVSASIWLRVPSGTLSTLLYIVNVGNQGWGQVGLTTVNLTTTWQQFHVTGTLQQALAELQIVIGSSSNSAFSNSQEIDIWQPDMQANSAGTPGVTNILPSSQQMLGSSWTIYSGSVTANNDAAPDGSTTASTVTPSSGSTDTRIVDAAANPSQYSGLQVTASVYLRTVSGTQTINVQLNNYTNTRGQIVGSTQANLNTTWQRFQITGTNLNDLIKLQLEIGGNGTFAAGQTIEVWGAQMVVGSTDGTYTETTNTTTNSSGAAVYLAANGLNESYSYDPFGNLQQSGNFTFQQAYTAGNQLSGWSYDASGNLLSDQVSGTYTYDANGMITTHSGATYYYDAEGNRVSKTGTNATDTVYFAGRPIARYSGGAWTDLIYGPLGILAEVPGTQTGGAVFRMLDLLGSAVGTLSASGSVLTLQDYAPFGQVFSGGVQDPYQFTGKERDTESGLDNFGARYYASSMGRFMSPDSYGGRLADPQSLNKYAYARNNPLIFVDPDGHDFNLTGCGQTNTTNCQNNMLGTYDNKGNFTATIISNGANGLQDQAGNSYQGQVTSAGVSFSKTGDDAYYGGSWINGSADTSFTQSGGALHGFSFDFTQPNTATGQTLAGTFSYTGSPESAERALENAGFSHSYFDALFNPLHGYDVTHYRGGGDPTTGAGAAHFILDDPYKVDDGVVIGPVKEGAFHFGETDPRVAPIQHIMHDVIPAFTTPH